MPEKKSKKKKILKVYSILSNRKAINKISLVSQDSLNHNRLKSNKRHNLLVMQIKVASNNNRPNQISSKIINSR